jgi:hypothetical protein
MATSAEESALPMGTTMIVPNSEIAEEARRCVVASTAASGCVRSERVAVLCVHGSITSTNGGVERPVQQQQT